MIPLVFQHHPDRALAHLGGKLVRRLARHSPVLSGVGASGKPGAVHIEQVLWPEFQQLDEALRRYLSEVTTRIIRDQMHKDVSEAAEVQPTTALSSRSSRLRLTPNAYSAADDQLKAYILVLEGRAAEAFQPIEISALGVAQGRRRRASHLLQDRRDCGLLGRLESRQTRVRLSDRRCWAMRLVYRKSESTWPVSAASAASAGGSGGGK